jgi:hypothetical protein
MFHLHKKTLLLLGVLTFIAFCVIVFGISQLYLVHPNKNTKTQRAITPIPSVIQKALIPATILPPVGTVLEAGKKQMIVVTFNQPQPMQTLSSLLTVKTVTNDQPPQPVPLSTQIINTTTMRLFTPVILSDSIYELIITNKKTDSIVFMASYTSSQPNPTPVENNNPRLAQFLPHQTPSYTL